MTRRFVAVLVAALLLSACTDDDGESINPREQEPAPISTAPAL